MGRKLGKRSPSTTPIRSARSGGNPEEPNLWTKCVKCRGTIYRADVRANFYVCPKCGAYFRLKAEQRIRMLADPGSFEPWGEEVIAADPLHFPGYPDKLSENQENTGLSEAVRIGAAKIGGIPAVLGVIDARFLMGSMGQAVGERITRAVERATAERLPVILCCCSGGARMQEGIVSLMQMAKTSAALKRHSEAGGFYISLLTDPTTGGVTASFAMLGDIILAEPGALIGFAGPRVIEQTIRKKLPEGFQRSEFQLEHGAIDAIVERRDQKPLLARLLRLHRRPEVSVLAAVRDDAPEEETPSESGFRQTALPAWETVELSRSAGRLTALDYIAELFPDFCELHGDRYYGDDDAVVGGIATFHGQPVTVIGQQKGKDLKENLKRNFAMPSPEGYRKALRLMKQAEKFHRPVICLVDTPGAYCGPEAEERGQGRAIAENLFEMSDLRTPVLSIVIGEGGSGGALALAVADEVWMLEHAVYSVLSPEGFASILWKDSGRAPEAAERMRMTAGDLYGLGIIEKVLPEFGGAEAGTRELICRVLDREIAAFLRRAAEFSEEERVQRRYERFRRF